MDTFDIGILPHDSCHENFCKNLLATTSSSPPNTTISFSLGRPKKQRLPTPRRPVHTRPVTKQKIQHGSQESYETKTSNTDGKNRSVADKETCKSTCNALPKPTCQSGQSVAGRRAGTKVQNAYTAKPSCQQTRSSAYRTEQTVLRVV